MGKHASSIASVRELVTRDPSGSVHNRLAVALGATVMTLVLFAPSAFRYDAAWRLLLAFSSGGCAVAWVRVAFDLVGRRARLRRAYTRWLRALGSHETLVEIISIHRELMRDALHPEEARTLMEALTKTAEESGIADSIRRWKSVKETLQLALDAERDELLAKHARAERERQERARLEQPSPGWITVRRVRPRETARVPTPLIARPGGIPPAIPNAMAASAHAAGVPSLAAPPPMPLREITRWAPFAQIGPLSKDLADLFGDDESLPPFADEGDRERSLDARGARHDVRDAPGAPRRAQMNEALGAGQRGANRGVVIESAATGEWIAPRRKSLFAKVVGDAREVLPRGCVGETVLKGRERK
jgi:hypothetical protein